MRFASAGLTLILPAGFALPSAQAESVSNAPAVAAFTLKDYLRQVLRHNESIQAQRLEAEVNRRKARGELGAFEPQLEASIAREVNKRTNNVEQQAALAGQGFFSERNTLYDGGLETLIPTGGKIRLGYTLDDFVNNVNPYPFLGTTNNPFIQQYQTFVGATFTQPLLKNAGFAPTLASYRLAALDSDIAFEQYRRQLMLTVYQAESAYWNLDFAQEQVRFFDESVAVAREVLNDTRQKLKAGQGAELDVLEAQSALALRNTKRNEAVQGYYDALGRLQMLTGAWPDPHRPVSSSPEFRVLDDARTTNAPPDYESCFQQAFSLNPDYLIQEKKIRQDRVRYRVANNQLLPELDLKAAYGFNGLGANPDDSWQVAASEDYPSWSVGLELIVPLGGNLKGRNLYHAARLSLQESALKLRGVQTQIANTLNIAIRKARAWRQSIQSYRTVVRYNEELLKTELARLEAGTVDAHKVLEVEADLLDSRQDLAGALTQYRGALLEIEVSDGSILKVRGLDVTRDQLRRQAGPAALSRR